MSSFSKILKDKSNSASNITTLDLNYENARPVVDSKNTATTYASSSETWQKHSAYTYFSTFSDDNISTISEDKDITLNPKQINISQEENSQYIPFQMNRYYDGFDLTKARISIHYETKNGLHGACKPINVMYSSNKIKFAWLVDSSATIEVGELKFEIHAYGNVSGDDGKSLGYIWKTKSNNELKVLESLCNCEEVSNEIDESWVQELITDVAKAVADEIKNVSVGEQVEAAKQAAISAQESAELAKGYADNASTTAKETVDAILEDYATKQYVKEMVDGVDVTEQLKDYVKSEQLAENYYNKSESDEKLNATLETYATKEILNSYYTKEETYNKSEVDEKLSNVKVDLSGYATETYVNNKVAVVSATADSNKKGIESISKKLTSLEEDISKIDTSPQLSYDLVYNDTEDPEIGENGMGFYEITNEGKENEQRVLKKKFIIAGGSGGGSGSVLKIAYVVTSPYIVTTNDKAIIKYNFSGTDSSGDIVTEGTATWKLDNKLIATNTAIAGENSFDITEYLSVGSHKLTLSIKDEGGSLATKTWTVQLVDVKIESDFNDATYYPFGNSASFSYTPYGSIDKTIHFKLDGVELSSVKTKSSGIPMSYTLTSQTHGSHLLETYITAELNGNNIESNHIYKDIIWYDSTNSKPVIGCVSNNLTIKQYDTANIVYTVYDSSTETPEVTLSVDGSQVAQITLESNTQTWLYKATEVGTHVLTITCGDTVKTINVEVEKLDIDVSPVTAGLEFDFNPIGYSNNDSDRLWSDKGITMTVSDNFDWVNGGYQVDENGDQYFCVKSGTTATINYNLFADDPKKNGKEFKVVFKTTNVKKRDTSFISCMDDNIGLDMKIESAYIYSNDGNLYSPYCEDDIIEFEFNINKNTDIPMVLTYEDGVANRPMIYTTNASFMQSNLQPITIGSEDCDVYIYRMKVYSNSLTDRNILSNFIADARNAEEMINRYNRNQIYDENNSLDPYVLAEKCPDLRIILVDCPRFTIDKTDKVSDTSITMIYKNGDPILDNWTCTGAMVSGQGTSSNEYGYSGRNQDYIMDGDDVLFTFGDGETTGKTITLTRNSTPTDYLNFKCNIASSENENNAQMTMRFNQYQPYIRPARLADPKKRDTMEFYNAVVFVREYNEDLSTHNEFNDSDKFHYYALGNIGDSKKTDDSRVFDKNDPKTCCIEVMDCDVALAEFPTGKADESGKKIICPESEWKQGNAAYDYLYADYKYKDGKFKSFGSESYEFRYEKDGITTEERQANIDSWREAYKFVVTSDDEKFKEDFDKYFVKDSILYFYLFTERYLMIDNRAKNLFFLKEKAYFSKEEAEQFKIQYGVEIQSEYINDEQAAINEGYRWNLTFGYDFDSCLGIDNTGKLVLTYGQEDVDYYTDGDPSSGYIYRAAESTFFCRVRDLFKSELEAMFVDRESAGAWSASGLINQWDNAQSQFPEEIWRLDTERKYLRTYLGTSIDNSIVPKEGAVAERFLVNMLNGRKKYHRRMFERNQELYMATKYFGNTATQNQIMMRFNNPSNKETDFTLYLTPYSDMYIGVKFGNFTPTNFRAKAGKQYTVPYTLDAADITLIYGASFIQEIGDLSKCYVGDNDFSKASRLRSLSIGSSEEGYSNGFMTTIGLGSNKLLEYLDIRNITGLNSAVDLSNCNNLRELYAQGSGATGVIFSNGGKLEKAYLPSISSLTVKNLNNLEVFDVESYDNLLSLIVENTPFLNTYDIVNSADKLNILRLVGMDWNEDYQINDTSILDRLLTLRGIGNDGYETAISLLNGYVFCAVMREKKLELYKDTWKNLEIKYNTLIEQVAVTFENENGDVLDVQYVDKGGSAVDPITRADNPIATPTLPSTVSTEYVFNGWVGDFNNIFEPRTIRATYSETTRSYTIVYKSKGTVKQTSVGKYGETIPYTGDTPTYTGEESGFKYYLFTGWDKSGVIDGDKTVEAVFDTCQYSSGYFDEKDLSKMRPVEIYALTKLDKARKISLSDYVDSADSITIPFGRDYTYSDIESVEIISQDNPQVFNGTNYYDSNISPMTEDIDFVFAVDYKMSKNTSSNCSLIQCYRSNPSGITGFKVGHNNGTYMTWGSNSTKIDNGETREMLVVRHKKGETGVHVYSSNLEAENSSYIELSGSTAICPSSIMFGCSKIIDGDNVYYENFAEGEVYWAKLWYGDLGDEACKELVLWTHESRKMLMSGFRKYYLVNNPDERCSMTFIADSLMNKKCAMTTASTNAGGWANMPLNRYMNKRMYEAIDPIWKQLVKQVSIPSSVGNKSTDISYSDCYLTLPALIELDSSKNTEPYLSEGSTSDYFISNSSRIRCYDTGDADNYWTRSPFYAASGDSANRYFHVVSTTGSTGSTYKSLSEKLGVLIELSI